MVASQFAFFPLFVPGTILRLPAGPVSKPGPAYWGRQSPTGEGKAHARIRQDNWKRERRNASPPLSTTPTNCLKLSLELKESVDKSDENVLENRCRQGAEEIEKLARSVKEKMKGPN
jgi:hypothetical protein